MFNGEIRPSVAASSREQPGAAKRVLPMMTCSRCLLTILVFLVEVVAFVLKPVDGDAAPTLPGEPCQVGPRPTWSDTEKWVWSQVCVGEIADLNHHFGRHLDPRSGESWTDERKLNSAFLETILLSDPWRSAIPRRGVRIVGAWFDEPVDLNDADVVHALWLDHSRLRSDVDLSGVRTQSALSLEGSTVVGSLNLLGARVRNQLNLSGAKVTGVLNMDAADVSGDLFMRTGAEFGDVNLRGARIERQLEMIAAEIAGTLNMDSATVEGNLLMYSSNFAEVILRGAQIGNMLDLSDAKVAGTLDLGSASIGSSLFMREGAEFTDVILRGSRVGHQLNLIDARVTGILNIESASIGDSLLMREGREFNGVNLGSARIGGQVDMTGTKVAGPLNMDGASIGGDLYLRGGAEFADVILRGAHVGGQLNMIRATVSGTLDMDSTAMGRDLFLRDGQFWTPIDLVFAQVGGNLDLRGATLTGLDLTGAHVGGELRLASVSRYPAWNDAARLILRNTQVVALQDEPEAWPLHLDLSGFTYERLGGLGANPATAVGQRGSKWFKDWLARDQPYTPQPYQHVAEVLREMGHPGMANDVLYAGRERAREEAWKRGDNLRWFGLSLLNLTIGYGLGHRYFWALYWVVGLVLIATVVLGVTGQNIPPRSGKERIGIWYSLDMLLPVIQLRKAHYEIDLEGCIRYWFYIHKLMGYVLASFLVAGLAGLTN